MRNTNNGSKIASGLFWTFAERIAAQLVSTVVSIVLARLLDPDHYGIISIVLIFISICDIFVSDGFGKTLVQQKKADLLDFNTMFWTSLGCSIVLYALLFTASGAIQDYYNISQLSIVIRVLGLRLILTSINTIQQAYVQRNMAFKKFFWATFLGTIISAFVGIGLAYKGFGVWALVAQYLTNTTVNTIVLYFYCGWRPSLQFSFARMKAMLPFSLRVLAQSLVYTFENNLRSLIIGKRFGATDLAYYSKGMQFPQLIMTNVNTSIGKVILPALAKIQDNVAASKETTRRSIALGMYILSPIMIGFCAVSDTFVSVLLTDKWLYCVPYLRILCIAYMMRPFETMASSAILALGRSDVTLRNIIVVNTVAVASVLVAVFTFNSVLLIALGTILSGAVSVILYSCDLRRYLKYCFREQIRDCIPSLVGSVIMAFAVYAIRGLAMGKIVLLSVQVVLGVVVYVAYSVAFKIKEFTMLPEYLKSIRRKG